MKKIIIDRSKCESIGICESIAPHVFEIQDDSSLLVKAEYIADERVLRLVEDAIEACPKRAISVVHAD